MPAAFSVKEILEKLFTKECSNCFNRSVPSSLFFSCGCEVVEHFTLSEVTINDFTGVFINNINNNGACALSFCKVYLFVDREAQNKKHFEAERAY
jgi:hypothetical protein